MINGIEAVVLGVIQGLTEFLPVSSSGHLVLMQNMMGLTEPELLFDVCVHIGTLLAVMAVFLTEIKDILVGLGRFPRSYKAAGSWRVVYARDEAIRMAVLIVIGSVPTVIIGLLFNEIADKIFGSIGIVGIMLLITGTALWLTKRVKPGHRHIKQMTVRDVLILGVVQGLAILPGISRSGATISTALFCGLERQLAGRFSFLLSLPAIMGALVLQLDFSKGHGSIAWGTILVGSIAAAVVGYLALRILLRIVKTGQLHWFSLYCWPLGVAALIWSIMF